MGGRALVSRLVKIIGFMVYCRERSDATAWGHYDASFG